MIIFQRLVLMTRSSRNEDFTYMLIPFRNQRALFTGKVSFFKFLHLPEIYYIAFLYQKVLNIINCSWLQTTLWATMRRWKSSSPSTIGDKHERVEVTTWVESMRFFFNFASSSQLADCCACPIILHALFIAVLAFWVGRRFASCWKEERRLDPLMFFRLCTNISLLNSSKN